MRWIYKYTTTLSNYLWENLEYLTFTASQCVTFLSIRGYTLLTWFYIYVYKWQITPGWFKYKIKDFKIKNLQESKCLVYFSDDVYHYKIYIYYIDKLICVHVASWGVFQSHKIEKIKRDIWKKTSTTTMKCLSLNRNPNLIPFGFCGY